MVKTERFVQRNRGCCPELRAQLVTNAADAQRLEEPESAANGRSANQDHRLWAGAHQAPRRERRDTGSRLARRPWTLFKSGLCQWPPPAARTHHWHCIIRYHLPPPPLANLHGCRARCSEEHQHSRVRRETPCRMTGHDAVRDTVLDRARDPQGATNPSRTLPLSTLCMKCQHGSDSDSGRLRLTQNTSQSPKSGPCWHCISFVASVQNLLKSGPRGGSHCGGPCVAGGHVQRKGGRVLVRALRLGAVDAQVRAPKPGSPCTVLVMARARGRPRGSVRPAAPGSVRRAAQGALRGPGADGGCDEGREPQRAARPAPDPRPVLCSARS